MRITFELGSETAVVTTPAGLSVVDSAEGIVLKCAAGISLLTFNGVHLAEQKPEQAGPVAV